MTPDAMVTAVAAGDVLLLKATWMMRRAGYVQEGAMWVLKTAAEPLPCRQEIEACHPEAILPADELLRIASVLIRHDRFGNEIPVEALPIVSVSHCWVRPSALEPRCLREPGWFRASFSDEQRSGGVFHRNEGTIPIRRAARCAPWLPSSLAAGARGSRRQSRRLAYRSSALGASRRWASSST